MRETPEGVYFGNLFGFPLFAHPTFVGAAPMLALLVFLAGSGGDLIDRLAVLVCLVLSVLAHELAHAFAARAAGVPVRHIALTWFGGYAEFWTPPARRWQEIAIALAGPLANVAIGAGALILADAVFPPTTNMSWGGGGMIIVHADAQSQIEKAARALASVNLALGLFNLLPGLPLDGGHVLRSGLGTFLSWRRAHAIAAFAGFVIGLGAIAYAVRVESIWGVLIGVFIIASAWDARRAA